MLFNLERDEQERTNLVRVLPEVAKVCLLAFQESLSKFKLLERQTKERGGGLGRVTPGVEVRMDEKPSEERRLGGGLSSVITNNASSVRHFAPHRRSLIAGLRSMGKQLLEQLYLKLFAYISGHNLLPHPIASSSPPPLPFPLGQPPNCPTQSRS